MDKKSIWAKLKENSISAKTGSFFLGYLSSALTCILMLVLYILAVACVIYKKELDIPPEINDLLILIAITIMLLSTPSLIFSVILLVGITKNLPGYVKAYFVYGLLVTVLMMLVITASLIYMIVMNYINNDVIRIFLYCYLGCFFYSLLLIMVRRTHKQMIVKKNDKNIVEN